MEKYVRIGVAAVIIAAAVLVGAIMFAKTPKEESKADVQELNLDEDAKKKVDIPVDFDELKKVLIILILPWRRQRGFRVLFTRRALTAGTFMRIIRSSTDMI